MSQPKAISQFFNAPAQFSRISEKQPLNDSERDAVVYFFAKLKLTDPRTYDQIMPDEKTEKIMKREFSEDIRRFSKTKIDKGFAGLHGMLKSNHPDFKFLTIPKVIGLVESGGLSTEGVQIGAYRDFPPLALPDKTAEEKARAAGARELRGLLEIFKDPEPEPNEKMYSPFCSSQIRALFIRQADATKQPYTCGSCDDASPLVPTEIGLICKTCSSKQSWVYFADLGASKGL